MQCLLDTVDSPKYHFSSLKNLYSWRLSAVFHLRFRSSTVMRRPRAVNPRSHPQWTHQCRHHHQWPAATRAVFTIPVGAVPSVSNYPIENVISVQSNHFALGHSEHEVPNTASAVISVQLSARHLNTQRRQCTKSQALELEDHPSLLFNGFQCEPFNT